MPRQECFENLEEVHSDKPSRPFQLFFLTDRGHTILPKGEAATRKGLQGSLPLDGIWKGHDPVDLFHHPDRPFESQLNRFRCFRIDQAKFGLQAIESLPGFIGAVDDLIPVHPFRFVVEDIFPTGGQ